MAKSDAIETVVVAAVLGAFLLMCIPFFGVITAVCVWLPWTYLGIGVKYLYFLPEVWQAPSLWDWFWIAFAAHAIRHVFGLTKIESKHK